MRLATDSEPMLLVQAFALLWASQDEKSDTYAPLYGFQG
jgi:hypothetical protein